MWFKTDYNTDGTIMEHGGLIKFRYNLLNNNGTIDFLLFFSMTFVLRGEKIYRIK